MVLMGCVEDPEIMPAPTGQVEAMFDPVGDDKSTPPVPVSIPTPTDLVKDPATGLLTGVPDRDGEGPAQLAFNAYLRTLDGYPTTATAEVRFTGKLKQETVNKDTIIVFDVTAKKRITENLIYDYREVDLPEDERIKSLVRIWKISDHGPPWERGHEYAFFVLSGSQGGVKDSRGKPLIRSTMFEIAIGAEPLCAWDDKRSWDAEAGACSKASDSSGATGCCTFNYSALLESAVGKGVHEELEGTGKSHEEIEIEAKKAILENATTFEQIRRSYDRLVTEAGVERDDVVVAWSFTAINMNEAIFDPGGNPPVLPKPTDLAFDPSTGFLGVTAAPGASPAELDFIDYLNSLDGWQANSTPSILFSAKLDPKSVSNKGLQIYQVDLDQKKVTPVSDVTTIFSTETLALTQIKKGEFKRGATYVAVALGGEGYLENQDQSVSKYPVRSALMELVLGEDPLCTWDSAKKACSDAQISSFIDDPPGLPDPRTGVEKATIFESMRRMNQPFLKEVITAGKLKQEQILAMWIFTVSTQTELIYDPTAGVIPFGNVILIDQKTGLVNIPPVAGETAEEKDLREGLNQLDGFSTQGSYYVPYSGTLDETTLKYGTSVIAIDVDQGLPMPGGALEFSVEERGPAVVVKPTKPLKEGNQYAVVLISRFEKGELKPKEDKGLKDAQGRRVVPASFMALKRSEHPLYDPTAKKSLVSVLDDATAATAEAARAGHKDLFDALVALQVEREDVVSAWVFKTQSITKPMTSLVTSSLSKLTAPKLTGAIDTTLTNFPAGVPKDGLGGWVPSGTFTSWLALDETKGTLHPDPGQGKSIAIPYMMAVPKGAAPATGWPVAIFQHAIQRSRKDFLGIANSLAKAGIATISFDLPYHGARSWCTIDAHCQGEPPGGCNVDTGVCSTILADTDGDGVVDASGAHFLNTENVFAIRDNFRQAVVDLAALALTIDKGGASGVSGLALDKNKVYIVGQDIGGSVAAMTMAVSDIPARGVFNVTGAPLVDIMLGSPAFKQLKDDTLKKFGITEGSLDYLQKIAGIFHMAIDPGDAGNFAAMLDPKSVMIQVAGQDQVIPPKFVEHFAGLAGVPTTDTTYAGQGHGFLLKPDPAGSLTATVAAQTQVVKFLLTGTICKPDVAAGTCN
jgi:dienelactone hydrolase